MTAQPSPHLLKAQRGGNQEGLEAEATRLLMDSLKVFGRGEYPFFSAGYLRRMAQADRGMARDDEAAHPGPPAIRRSVLWRLARKAALDSLELAVLRLAVEGAKTGEAAQALGISARRARAVLHRAVGKMQDQVAALQATVSEQVAVMMYEDQQRRGFEREKHCKRGHEACRRTGLCVKRWYLRGDE